MRLVLVRHGETEGQSSFRYWGSTDLDLDETGKKQAEKLADRLRDEKFDAIYTSELKRSIKTAEAICKKHNVKPVKDKRLNEINFGDIEGLTFEQIQEKHPDLTGIWNDSDDDCSFPNGESFKQFNLRVKEYLEEIISKHDESEDVLIVGHGGPFRLMACHLLGIDTRNWRKFRYSLASVTVFDVHEEFSSLCLFGDTSHLK